MWCCIIAQGEQGCGGGKVWRVPAWCCVCEQSVCRYCAGKCWDPVLVLLSATEASPVTSELALGHVDAASVPSPHILASLLVAVSVPKKKRRMKELNKKEAVGDLLDAFKEVSVPRHLRITLHPMPSCDEFYFVPSCLGH